MKLFNTSFKVLAIAVILSVGISVAYAWTSPTSAPPAGNVSAPLNVGSTPQSKAGSLSIGGVIKIGAGITTCNAAAAGTIGYDITKKALQYCDGAKIRQISFLQEVPQIQLSAIKTTVASGIPTVIYVQSNDVSTCNVSAISDPLSPFDTASKSFAATIPMTSPLAGDSSVVYGSVAVSPTFIGTNKSGVIRYQVTCANTNSAAQGVMTLSVKKYEALTTSGTGNWDETCVDYLTRVGVRGDKNISPAVMIDGTLTQNKCKYEVKHERSFSDLCIFCSPLPNTFEYGVASRAGDSETPARTECGILCFPDNGPNMRPVIDSLLYTAGR